LDWAGPRRKPHARAADGCDRVDVSWFAAGIRSVFLQSAAHHCPAGITNGFATAGFVCGIISCLCCCGCPFNLLGLIFSITALVQIHRQTDKQHGWGLALTGLICSAVSLLLTLGLGIFQLAANPVTMGWHYSAI